MDAAWVQARIDALKLIIVAIEQALLALEDPLVTSYTIDTGQTIQTVRRQDTPALINKLGILGSQLAGLENLLTGRHVNHPVPAW